MNLGQCLVAAAATATLLFPGSAWPQIQDVGAIAIPELRSFRPEQPRLVTLPNGMVLMLEPDQELPLVRGYALIRGGSRDEPADKVGLVSIYGQAWRTGGTKVKGHSGDELDELLENKAALVETAGGLDATSVSWDCMKGDFDAVMGIVAEMLRTEPVFPQDKIELAKTQISSAIARRNDDPDAILRRESRRLVYGATSPYARIDEYTTISAVTRDDLVAWHRRYVHPNNIVMAVWGDFDARQMERRLRQMFADWPRGTPAQDAKISVPAARPGYYLVEKDDVTQSKIQMAHLGLRRDTRDFYAIEVMNEVLAGGFGSRLMTDVRAKQGLAYHVWGGLGMAYDYPGLFRVGMGTKSDTTVRGIEALLAEVDAMTQRPVSETELAHAKDGLLNSFIFRIDSREKVLHEKVSDYFHGYPLDLLERYMDGVRAVSASDVTRVAREYLHKDKLAVLVVGRPSDFDRPLTSLGPVTKVDITIPAPSDASAR